jgi:hypothetical protein
MNGGTIGTYLELLRVITFILDTKRFGLKIRPSVGKKNLNLNVFCDSDWAGDAETRMSVTGLIIYLMGIPVSRRSKEH